MGEGWEVGLQTRTVTGPPKTPQDPPRSLHLPLWAISVAAVTNYHKLSDLQWHKFIILPFWRSEVWNGSYWAKIKLWVRLLSFLEERPVFQLLVAACIPWFLALPPSKPAAVGGRRRVLRPFHHSNTDSSASPSSYKDASDYTGPTWITQATLPTLKFSWLATLIPPDSFPSTMYGNLFTGSGNQDVSIFRRSLFSLPRWHGHVTEPWVDSLCNENIEQHISWQRIHQCSEGRMWMWLSTDS